MEENGLNGKYLYYSLRGKLTIEENGYNTFIINTYQDSKKFKIINSQLSFFEYLLYVCPTIIHKC